MKRSLTSGYKTLNRYLVKEFFFSFAVSFLFFFIIFFVNQILLLAEQILSNRVPLKYVLRLIFYSLPTILALTFPFATLVGALMALGRLSSDNEVLAMQCAGISLRRISLPFIAIGFLFSLLSFSINDYLLPLGNLQYKKLYREIFTSNPTLELDSWSVRQMDERILVTGEVSKNRIDQMVIIENSQGGRRTVITASNARIYSGESLGDLLSIQLDKVESISSYHRDRERFSFTRAEGMTYNFLLSELTSVLGDPTPSEMRSLDVFRGIRQKDRVFKDLEDQWRENLRRKQQELALRYSRYGYFADSEANISRNRANLLLEEIRQTQESRPTDRSLDFWRMEFYQKFAIPFSCIPFVLLAFPLGVLSRRSGRTFGFIAGLALTFIYWAFLIVGRSLVMRSGIAPFFAIWASNILLLTVGLILYFRRTNR